MGLAPRVSGAWLLINALWSVSICFAAGKGKPATEARLAVASSMRVLIEQFVADRSALMEKYPLRVSPARLDRLQRFYNDELATLRDMNFEAIFSCVTGLCRICIDLRSRGGMMRRWLPSFHSRRRSRIWMASGG